MRIEEQTNEETCLKETSSLSGEDFGHNLSISQCFLPSPTNYIVTSFGFSLINWGIFYKFL